MTAAPALSLADLEAFDPNAPDRGGRERRFCCPHPPCAGKPINANHRSLSVNKETGAWRCSRCDGRGKLREWWQDRPKESHRTRSLREVRRAFALPEPSPQLLHDETIETWRRQLASVQPLAGSPAVGYLHQRGIPADLAHAAGARYSSSWYGRPAVVFPVRDREENLVAAQGRHLDQRVPKMHSAGEIRLGVFTTPGAWAADPLILVEAPCDALTLAAAGFPAIALVGASNLPHWLPQACAFRRVLLALDGDDAGDRASQRLAAVLAPLGAKVERLRPEWFKDWNELGPRLVEGLPAALAAALTEQTPTVGLWDEPTAWARIQAAVRSLPDILSPDSIAFAELFAPELLEPCDQADAAINEAYANEDAAALDRALSAFHTAHQALALGWYNTDGGHDKCETSKPSCGAGMDPGLPAGSHSPATP